MLHILTTLIATALLATSTGANAVKNYETHEDKNKTALKALPKRAYYDPAETYGHTEGRAYFYTENVNTFVYRTGTWETVATLPNGSIVSCAFGISSDGMNVIQYREIGQYNPTYFTNEASSLDVYLDGNFAYTITPQNSSDLLCYSISATSLEINNTNHYLWVFDHQEPDPIGEMNENIFEAVGDTITGLSDALTKPWDGILNIFYDTTENEVTQLGYLVMIGLGVSITLLVFWTILRLFKQRN